eukprot:155565_1
MECLQIMTIFVLKYLSFSFFMALCFSDPWVDVEITFSAPDSCVSCWNNTIQPSYANNYYDSEHCDEGFIEINCHSGNKDCPHYRIEVSPVMLLSKCGNLVNCNFTYSGKGVAYITFDSVSNCNACYSKIVNPVYSISNLCGSGSETTGSISLRILNETVIDYVALTLESSGLCTCVDLYIFESA